MTSKRILRGLLAFSCAAMTWAIVRAQETQVQAPSSVRQYLEIALQYSHVGEFDKAVREYSEAIRLDPKNIDAFLGRAAAYLQMGKNSLAFHDYAEAVHNAPSNFVPYYNVGEAYWKLGDKVSALAIFRKCLTMDIRLPSAAVAMGDHFFSEGLNQEALTSYSRVVDLAGNSSVRDKTQWIESSLIKRSAVKQKLGDTAGAFQDLNQAIEANPRSATGLTARGKLFFQTRKDAAAIKDLNDALQINPMQSDARLIRSQILAETRQYQPAMEDLNAALQHSPKMAEIYDMRGLLWSYGFGNYERAIDDLNSALAIDPQNSQIYYDLATIRTLRHEFQKAAEALTLALKFGGSPSPILERRAKIYAFLGNFTGASDDIRNALNRDPDVGSLHVALGTIDLTFHTPDQAINDMKAVEEDGLNSPELHAVLGAAYAATGNLGKALKELRIAVRQNPRSAQLNDLLCRALRQNQDAGAALPVCDQAIQLDPKSAVAYIDRGLAHLDLQHSEEAIVDFNKGHELGARYAEGELARSAAHALLGQWKASDEAYRSALFLDPRVRNPELSFNQSRPSGKTYSNLISTLEKKISREKKDPYASIVLGDSLHNSGNPTAALAEYSKAIQSSEPVYAAFLNRCIALAGQKSLPAAEQNCRRALELAADEPAIHIQLLKILEQRRDYDAGTQAAARALRTIHNSPGLYVQAGNFFYFLYDLSDAERNYSLALSLDPFFADAYVGLGICELTKKKTDDAIDSFSRAIFINDRRVDYFLHRASAYDVKGDYQNAAADYKNAIATNHDPSLTSQLEKLYNDETAKAKSKS